LFDVAQIVQERLEFLKENSENSELSSSERFEAVFEIIEIKRAAQSLEINLNNT